MYLPRHYEDSKKPQSSNIPFYLFIFVLIIIIITGIYKRKEIVFFFSGNTKQKVIKLETKIIDAIHKKKLDKELVNEFKVAALNSFNQAPADPVFNYYMAKGFYYQLLLDGFKINSGEIIKTVYIDNIELSSEPDKYEENLSGMYRNSLRAISLGSDFSEYDSARLMAIFYETLEKRKNPLIIMNEISRLSKAKLSKELINVYVWLNLLTSCFAGSLESLESFNNMNNEIEEDARLNVDPREFIFLKAVTSFHSNDYVKSLEFFREIQKGEFDLLTVEAIRYEANIFLKQNLPDKSLALLEDLYEKTGMKNDKIKEQIIKVLESKAGLKSRLGIQK